jgi:drug/metabolite transporter (DMT)-like permease
MADLIIGIIIGLLSSALFAIQNVLIRGQREGVNALIANSIKMWVSLPLMLALVVIPWRNHEFLLPPAVLLPLAISVLLGGAFGDAAYLFALFLLHDVLRVSTTIGIILAICGVILVSRELAEENSEEKENQFDWWGLALALTSSVMFAFATIFMEIGVTNVDPIDANLFRMSIGSIAMVPIFSISYKARSKPLSKRAAKIIAVAGFFGMGFASLLYVASIKLIGATIGAVIGSTAPLFALPISIIYLKERVTWRGVFGTIATIVGIWLVVASA